MERMPGSGAVIQGMGGTLSWQRAGLLLPGQCLLAAGIGAAAWMERDTLAPLALLLLLPLLVARAAGRRGAFCIAFAYYGSATRAVPGIIGYFFPSLPLAACLALWAAHCALLALPWALALAPSDAHPGRRVARMLAALVGMSMPPIGLFHWGSPLMAAGLLYPGWQWAGLVLTAMLLTLLAACQWNSRPFQVALAAACALSALANLGHRTPAAPAGWHAVSLAYGKSPGLWSDDMAARRAALAGIALRSLDTGAKVIIFPESIAGSSRRPQDSVWRPVADLARRNGATVLVGEERWNAERTGFRNALVDYGSLQEGGQVTVSSMVPMPVGDWKFGLEEGAETNIFGSDLVVLHGRRVAFSMCYEDFLLWPHRGLLAGRAELLVSVTNQWPSAGTSAEGAQDVSRRALARLAGVPLLTAKNH